MESKEQKGDFSRNKGGRPKKSLVRSSVLVVRLLPSERLKIEQRAKDAGMKTAEWFRRAAKSAAIKPRLSPQEMEYLRKLAGQSNNLNQLTKLAHTEGLVSILAALRSLMSKLNFLMDKLTKDGRKTDQG